MYQVLFDSILKVFCQKQTEKGGDRLFRSHFRFKEGSSFISMYLGEIESALIKSVKSCKVLGFEPGLSDFVIDPDLLDTDLYLVLSSQNPLDREKLEGKVTAQLEKLKSQDFDIESFTFEEIPFPHEILDQSFTPLVEKEEEGIENTVRVHHSRLDGLVRQLTEAFSTVDYFSAMIANLNQSQFPSENHYLKYLKGEAQNFSTINKNQLLKICRKISDLTLLPFSLTVRNLSRVVSSISEKQGKEIEYIPLLSDAYLNGRLSEIIYPVLLHLIRNCVDHGIEPKEHRIALGKNPRGKIILQAFNEPDGSFFIQLFDDGKGMDLKRIGDKALGLGLVSPDELKSLTPDAVVNFIFHTGFSTAEEVTTVSGRGLGMDIVKKNLQREKGSIKINSYPGKGCQFLIKIPNFSPIEHVQVFQVGDEFYSISNNNILKFGSTKKEPIESLGKALFLLPDGEIGLDLTELIFPDRKNPPLEERVFFEANTFWGKFILLADRILGDFAISPKDPGAIFMDLGTLAGVSKLADGTMVSNLYLDTFIHRVYERCFSTEMENPAFKKMQKMGFYRIKN